VNGGRSILRGHVCHNNGQNTRRCCRTRGTRCRGRDQQLHGVHKRDDGDAGGATRTGQHFSRRRSSGSASHVRTCHTRRRWGRTRTVGDFTGTSRTRGGRRGGGHAGRSERGVNFCHNNGQARRRRRTTLEHGRSRTARSATGTRPATRPSNSHPAHYDGDGPGAVCDDLPRGRVGGEHINGSVTLKFGYTPAGADAAGGERRAFGSCRGQLSTTTAERGGAVP